MLNFQLRSKTRIRLNKITTVLVCLNLAMPPMAIAGGTGGNGGGTPQGGNSALAASLLMGGGLGGLGGSGAGAAAQAAADQAKLEAAHREKVEDLRRQAQDLKLQAGEIKKKTIDKLNEEIQALPDRPRRTEVGKLEPRPQEKPAASATKPESKGAEEETPPPAPARNQPPSRQPAANQPIPPAPTTSFRFGFGRTYVFFLWADSAFAVDRESLIEPKPTFDYEKASTETAIKQIKERTTFITRLGALGANLTGSGDKIFATYDRAFATGQALTPEQYKTDYMSAIRDLAVRKNVDPEATVEAVRLHLFTAADNEAQRIAAENKENKKDGLTTVPQLVAHAQDDGGGGPGLASRGISRADQGRVEGAAKNDLDETVSKVLPILAKGLEGLETAKGLEAKAAEIERQAAKLQSNPPKAPQQNANNMPFSPQGGGGGGGGEGDGNKGKGGGQGTQLAGPGGIPDSSSLFAKQPDSADASAAASASQFEQQPNPRWDGNAGGLTNPNFLRQTGNIPVTPTSGPAMALNNFIPGNQSPAGAIGNGGTGGGGDSGGGGDKPASIGGSPSGGTAGGAFAGDDVGRGIGPSYGGRAGLNDPVKRFEAGPGGGSVSSESSPTIATGADGSSPQLQGQIATGRKIRDGAGKGGLGLMGQVSTLLQSQCGDSTQRVKLQDFCVNASSVASRAVTKKEDQIAYSEASPRRDLAGERAVTSSK